MCNFSSPVDEASSLLIDIAPRARSKSERRLAAWRRLRPHFSFNRVCEIDRKSLRVVVTADEMKILREAAARGAPGEYQNMDRRLAALEAEIAALRLHLGGAVPEMEKLQPNETRRASDAPRAQLGSKVVSPRALGLGARQR